MASIGASVVRMCPECQRRLAEQHAAYLASLERTRRTVARLSARQARINQDEQQWAAWLETRGY